jgi:glyoxylase I family protein
VSGVDGIGGFFFRAEDPEALSAWYEQHIGVLRPPTSYDDPVWEQEAGPTVFAPFGADASDSPIVGSAGWGINFRVADLDRTVAGLRAQDVEVEVDPTEYPNGRFAQLRDPEGNAVQLWQPA